MAISSYNLIDFPDELLTHMSRYVASKNPKDLLNLGAVCKRIHEIVNDVVFTKLIGLCKQSVALRTRLNLLTGWDGNSLGLIKNAHNEVLSAQLKLEQVDEENLIVGTANEETGAFQEALEASVYAQNDALQNAENAYNHFLELNTELDSLLQYDANVKINGGMIYECQKDIENEVVIIQHSLWPEELIEPRKRKLEKQ